MDSSHWVHIVEAMVHCFITGYFGQACNIVVCPPLVTVDDGAWVDMALDNWEQGLGCAIIYNLHKTCSRLCGLMDHTAQISKSTEL